MSNLWIAVATPSCSSVGARLGPVRPALGRHVEALRRGVDDARIGHHRRGADGLEPSRQIDREHSQHPEPREGSRPADVAALDEGPLRGCSNSAALEPVRRQPARDPRRGDDGAVAFGGRGKRLLRAAVGLLERELGGHLRRHDDPHGPADQAGGDVGAVKRQRPHDPQCLRVGDVDLGQHRLCRGVRSHLSRDPRKRLNEVAAAREDEQPISMQEQLVAPATLQLQRIEQARPRVADVDRVQPPVTHREERRPVRLHEIGLVDAFLLHIRAGVVDALLRRCRTGRRALGRDAERDTAGIRDHAAGEAPRADETGRLRLHVAEQVTAGAE